MTFFLILAPFVTFAGLSYVASQTPALLVAAVVALAMISVTRRAAAPPSCSTSWQR